LRYLCQELEHQGVFRRCQNQACLESKSFDFSEGYSVLQEKIYAKRISFIFDYAAGGGDKTALLQMAA